MLAPARIFIAPSSHRDAQVDNTRLIVQCVDAALGGIEDEFGADSDDMYACASTLTYVSIVKLYQILQNTGADCAESLYFDSEVRRHSASPENVNMSKEFFDKQVKKITDINKAIDILDKVNIYALKAFTEPPVVRISHTGELVTDVTPTSIVQMVDDNDIGYDITCCDADVEILKKFLIDSKLDENKIACYSDQTDEFYFSIDSSLGSHMLNSLD